jgi:hypothetical protein
VARAAERGLGRSLRLLLLVGVLAIVLAYAAHDMTSRRARTSWTRTLDVAFVIVTQGAVDAEATRLLARRVPDLATRLAEELARYRPGAPKPFQFVVYGPRALDVPLPADAEEGLWGAARHAFALLRFTRAVDEELDVPARGFDTRLYVVVRPASERALVEGQSEHGGRVGLALVELDAETVDTALLVAAHELFHTLGASDRYGPDGRALVPDGLVEPDRTPLYPQPFAEVMARNRPVSPTEEVRLESLSELGVGRATAAELGWLR